MQFQLDLAIPQTKKETLLTSQGEYGVGLLPRLERGEVPPQLSAGLPGPVPRQRRRDPSVHKGEEEGGGDAGAGG